MTVSANDAVERYTISGTGPYAFSFRIFADTDLTVVALSTDSPPEVVPLTLTTHYTVAGENVAAGGTVTLEAAAASTYAGYTLDIRSNTPETQPTSIRNTGRFLPEIHEDAYDRLSRQIQDLRRVVNASIRYPDNEAISGVVEPASDRKGFYLVWDAVTGALTRAALSATTMTQAIIAALLNPRTDAEIAAGVTPVNYAYLDVRRMGVTGDGTTDDTVALQKCYTVGGAWEEPPGFHIRTTATITVTLATRLYNNGPRAPGPAGITQAFIIHDFDGPMFDLVGSAANSEYNNGSALKGVSIIQNHGDGTGSSGVCIRNVATSDTQRCSWMDMEDCQIETVTGKNDWTGGILLDGTANTSGTEQLRNIFIKNCRIVGGTNCQYAIKSNGAQNIFLSDVLGNLANSKLILTGDATHLSSSVSMNGCSFSDVELDYATNVRGAGNSASNFTSTANTVDVDLGLDTGASAPTILGTRVTVFGLRSDGKWCVNSNNTARFELGANDLEISGPLVGESRVQGTMLRATDVATGAAGTVTFGDGSQSTVGAAGGASALPATPTGYMRFFLGTTEYVLPYYAQA